MYVCHTCRLDCIIMLYTAYKQHIHITRLYRVQYIAYTLVIPHPVDRQIQSCASNIYIYIKKYSDD